MHPWKRSFWMAALALVLALAAGGPLGAEMGRTGNELRVAGSQPAATYFERAAASVPSTPGETPALTAVGRMVQASETARDAGIAWYAFAAEGRHVHLLGADGLERGTLEITRPREGGSTLSPRWMDGTLAGNDLLAVWTDLRRALHDDGGGAPSGTGDVSFMTAAFGDASCDYFYPYSAGGIAGNRSVACQQATDRLNNLCTNPYCIGCCDKLDCDCVCLPGLGDFGCYCERVGYACMPSDCEIECEGGSGGGGGGGSGGTGGGSGSGSGAGDSCVPVSCNGIYVGDACGSTAEEIIQEAWDMC